MEQAYSAIVHRRSTLALAVFAAAALTMLFAIALNALVERSNIRAEILTALQRGSIESDTPPELAPRTLVARAQADCRQLIFFSFPADGIRSALLRNELRDKKKTSSRCVLLAAQLTASGRDRTDVIQWRGSPSAAIAVTYPILSMFGMNGTRGFHLMLILAAAAVMLTSLRHPGRREMESPAIAVGLATAMILLSLDGSISLLPISLALFAYIICAHYLSAEVWNRHGAIATALLGSALFAFDPAAASVPVGLGLVLYVAGMGRPDMRRMGVAALIFLAAVSASILIHAILAGLVDGKIAKSLSASLLDKQATYWAHDLSAAIDALFDTVAAGPLHSKLATGLVLWSLPFGIALYAALPQSSISKLAAALIAAAPPLVWVLFYPGYVRRAPDDYGLILAWPIAVATAGAVLAVIAMIRLVMHRFTSQAAVLADA